MTSSRSPFGRRIWLIIFGALVFSVLAFGLACYLIEHSSSRHVDPNLRAAHPIFVALGIITLLASVTWLRLRVDSRMGHKGRDLTLSPQKFQSESLVALCLSEACSYFGMALFFMGAPLHEFALFGLGTIFVDLAFILPRGLQFWSAHERSNNV